MKNYAVLFLLCFSCLLFMGMGELGGTAPVEKIPIPSRDFRVEVIDRLGVKTSLSQFSHEGKVVLSGKRGQAQVAIPFEIISRIELTSASGSEILLRVALREAKSYEIKVEKKSKFYGKAEFGTYRIEAQDLQAINFLP